MADEETWQCEFQGAKSYGAYGLRDVLILANSQAQLVQPTAVARERGELTASDRDRLGSQGFPGQSWETEEELVEARYVKDSTRYHNVLVMQCSGLAREDILRSIRNVLSGTSKPGATVHYIGAGRSLTGDWCFRNGFVTFADLTSLYLEYFRGRVLEIYCDCSYSGTWVRNCEDYLDHTHTRPCGHSARLTGNLLKVRASCQHDQVGRSWLFSARGCGNDKNTGRFFVNESTQLCQGQRTCDVDSTIIACRRSPDKECCLQPHFTYSSKRSYAERLEVASQMHQGRKAWFVVLLEDDPEKVGAYRRKTLGEGTTITLGNYGKVLRSGWGEKPPVKLITDIRTGVEPV